MSRDISGLCFAISLNHALTTFPCPLFFTLFRRLSTATASTDASSATSNGSHPNNGVNFILPFDNNNNGSIEPMPGSTPSWSNGTPPPLSATSLTTSSLSPQSNDSNSHPHPHPHYTLNGLRSNGVNGNGDSSSRLNPEFQLNNNFNQHLQHSHQLSNPQPPHLHHIPHPVYSSEYVSPLEPHPSTNYPPNGANF